MMNDNPTVDETKPQEITIAALAEKENIPARFLIRAVALTLKNVPDDIDETYVLSTKPVIVQSVADVVMLDAARLYGMYKGWSGKTD